MNVSQSKIGGRSDLNLKGRVKKCLEFQTPYEVFEKLTGVVKVTFCIFTPRALSSFSVKDVLIPESMSSWTVLPIAFFTEFFMITPLNQANSLSYIVQNFVLTCRCNAGRLNPPAEPQPPAQHSAHPFQEPPPADRRSVLSGPPHGR